MRGDLEDFCEFEFFGDFWDEIDRAGPVEFGQIWGDFGIFLNWPFLVVFRLTGPCRALVT